jgi:hypothetical protein
MVGATSRPCVATGGGPGRGPRGPCDTSQIRHVGSGLAPDARITGDLRRVQTAEGGSSTFCSLFRAAWVLVRLIPSPRSAQKWTGGVSLAITAGYSPRSVKGVAAQARFGAFWGWPDDPASLTAAGDRRSVWLTAAGDRRSVWLTAAGDRRSASLTAGEPVSAVSLSILARHAEDLSCMRQRPGFW